MDKELEKLLEELEELEAKATPRPFRVCPGDSAVITDCSSAKFEYIPQVVADFYGLPNDANLFATSRNSLKTLIQIIRVQNEALEFYANKDNWDEENSLGQTPSCWDSGSVDLGLRAMSALYRVNQLASEGKK